MNRAAEVQGKRVKGKGFAPLYLVPCVFALLLSACGFHLREPVVLPESMLRVQLQGTDPYGELAYEMADALARSGANVVAAGEQSAPAGELKAEPPAPAAEPVGAIIRVEADRFQSVVGSVDENGRATEYELRYTLTASLREPGKGTLVPAKTVVVRKLLAVNPSKALGTSNEQEVLQREMRRDGVHQLLRQLRNGLMHRNAPSAPSPADENPR